MWFEISSACSVFSNGSSVPFIFPVQLSVELRKEKSYDSDAIKILLIA